MGNTPSADSESDTNTDPGTQDSTCPASTTRNTQQSQDTTTNNHHSSSSSTKSQIVTAKQPTTPNPTTQEIHNPIPASRKAPASTDVPYKVFISHAGEDKATIAIPLREKLAAHNISAFVDEEDMHPGTDSIQAMTAAMETIKVAVVVLSPEFVARKWPMKELMCFLRRYENEEVEERDRPVIIPVFYRLKVEDLHHEPRFDRRDKNGKSLYDMSRFFQRMSAGEPEADIPKVKEALGKLHKIMGIRNDDDATNESTVVMARRRESMLQRICHKVVEVTPREYDHAETMSTVQETDSGSNPVDQFRVSFPLASFSEPAVLHFDALDEMNNPTKVEGWVKRHLLDKTSESTRVVAIHGIGGVGKSTVLQALATDGEVRREFPDGVHVIRLGADATKEKFLKEICRVLRASGAEKTERHVVEMNDVDTAVDKLEQWFEGRRCVFLIDDVWELVVGERVLQLLCNIGVEKSGNSVLLTTRESKIASLAPSKRIIHMKPLEARGGESREMLFFHAEYEEPDVMRESSEEAIERILDICGGLAVGLSVAGKNLKRMKINLQEEEEVWKLYEIQLGACASALWREDVGGYKKLFATFETSLSFLDEKQKEDTFGFKTKLTVREMYWRFSVLSKQDIVPGTMLKSLWETGSVGEAEKIATLFVEMGLASLESMRVGKQRRLGLRLHDSLHDFAVWEASHRNKTKEAHEKLLAGYSSCDGDVSLQVNGTRKWWSDGLLEDGYIHRNICRHMEGAGLGRELVNLLMMPGWASKQLKVNGILALEDDFSFGLKSMQRTRYEETARQLNDTSMTLQVIWETFSMSWAFAVALNRRELWFQVYGRLVGLAKELDGIREYLKRIKEEAEKPWLLIKNCLLSEPGTVNTKTFNMDADILCMVQMGDCERVACGCITGTIVVLNLRRGEVECCWEAHDQDVLGIAIARNGSRLVSMSIHDAKVWHVDTQKCVATLAGHNHIVRCRALTENGKCVVASSLDRRAQVWDMETGQVVSEPFTDHEASVICVSVLGDEDHVVTGGSDGKFRLWNTTSCTQLEEPFVGHTDVVRCVSVTPDGKLMVSGSRDSTVRIWDIKHRLQLGESLMGHTKDVTCVCVSRDGARIASGSDDGTIKVWDLESRKEVCVPLDAHRSTVTGVSFLVDRHSIVSCSIDGYVRAWNLLRMNSGGNKEKHDDEVSSVAFSTDGKRVVSGSYDHTLRIWNATSGRQVGDALRGHSAPVICVAPVPNGKRFVSVSLDGTLRLWDTESKENIRTFTGHVRGLNCCAVSANGDCAVTGCREGTILVWNLAAMDDGPIVLQGHSKSLEILFFSDDGKHVISVDYRDNILVWELDTQQQIKKFLHQNARYMEREEVLAVAGETTTRDDVGLLILPRDRKIGYRNEERCEVLGTPGDHVTSWTVSSDKRIVVVGLCDGRVGFMELELKLEK